MFPAEHQMKKVCVITWCYTGDPAKAEAAFKPIRAFSPPLMDFCGPIPFPALQSLFDGLYPAGLQWYWKADFLDLSDKAIVAPEVRAAAATPCTSPDQRRRSQAKRGHGLRLPRRQPPGDRRRRSSPTTRG